MPNHATATPSLDAHALRAGLAGRVLEPGDDGYDDARQGLNAAIDRRPALVVQPADAGDVARALGHARAAGAPIAVRGAGHGFAGHGAIDGGVVLDMRAMRAVSVDPAARQVWAQAGATAGDVTAAASEHGLAVGFGDTAAVGVAGITLGGGIGWLVRKHGMTIDHLLAAEVVTADGELRQVDATHEPDLFWALRGGGGGNLGIVTRLRFGLEPVGTMLGGMLVVPADPATLLRLIEIAAAAPDELTVIVHAALAPPAPFIPPEHQGELVLMIGLLYAGEPADGERVVAPIRDLAPPLFDDVRAMRYPEILEAEGPPPGTFALRSALLDELDGAAVQALLDGLTRATTPMAVAEVRVLGGAMARVPADATAFAHRDRRLMVTLAARSEDPADAPALEASVTARATAAGLDDRDAYVNYLGTAAVPRMAAAYPAPTAARLAAIKRRYDPDDVFRGPYPIARATS